MKIPIFSDRLGAPVLARINRFLWVTLLNLETSSHVFKYQVQTHFNFGLISRIACLEKQKKWKNVSQK